MSMSPPPPPPPPMPPGGAYSTDTVPGGRPLAEPWMRVLARFLDALIVGLVFGFIFSGMLLDDGDTAGFGGLGADASFGQLYVLGLLSMAVGFVWDAVLTKQFGGTPMKLAFGMRVVRADDGGPVEWRHAILRWAIPGALALIPLPLLPGLVNLVIIIVSLVFLFTKPLRQTIWDQVAKTLVVKVR
ncbi:MAG: RDD family protein [Acidimicrobiia bacterium]